MFKNVKNIRPNNHYILIIIKISNSSKLKWSLSFYQILWHHCWNTIKFFRQAALWLEIHFFKMNKCDFRGSNPNLCIYYAMSLPFKLIRKLLKYILLYIIQWSYAPNNNENIFYMHMTMHVPFLLVGRMLKPFVILLLGIPLLRAIWSGLNQVPMV